MRAAFHRNRVVGAVVVAIMIGGAALTYQAKQQAIEAAERVSELRLAATQERIAISLLKAEWSELTQPARLQELIGRYPEVFRLAPFDIDRMVRIRNLPYREGEEPDLIAETLVGAQL